MLSGGAIGLGLVIGWAGGFAGTRPTAVAYRIGAGALALFLLAAAGTETMVSGACGLAVAAIGHEAFVAAIRQRRSR